LWATYTNPYIRHNYSRWISLKATGAGVLMIAVQALEKRTAELKQKEAQIAVLESKVEDLKAKHAYFETVAARLEALELRKNPSIQITAEKSLGDKMVDVIP
jgi:3-deoxy-D-manno-octulosonate 8-phosphate phosphatase KdsC-like HAD superfamily phosphatase